jgi:hypothetical protein
LLDATFLAGWAVVRARRRIAPGNALGPGLVLLELTLVVDVAVDALVGAPAAEPVVHACYLVAGAALLPVTLLLTRGPDDRGWGSATIAVVCVALVVLQLRIIATGATWFPAGT